MSAAMDTRPVHRRDLPRSQRVAPMDMESRQAEADARASSPSPDAPSSSITLHLNLTHAAATGRHAAHPTRYSRGVNITALRKLAEVTR